MKISTLRENITGSEKNCRNKYVHETRSGNYYLDSGIGFIQGECVFEGTPSYDEHRMISTCRSNSATDFFGQTNGSTAET